MALTVVQHKTTQEEALGARYGTRTSEIELRLDQAKSLSASQLKEMLRIWEASWQGSRTVQVNEAVEATFAGMDEAVLDAMDQSIDADLEKAVDRVDLEDDDRDDAADALRDMILGELTYGKVAPAVSQALMGPFELVAALPSWWTEGGSQALFFDILAQGSSIEDARDSVGALVQDN